MHVTVHSRQDVDDLGHAKIYFKQTQKKMDFSLCTVSFFISFFSATSIMTSLVYSSLSREPLPVLHGSVCGQEPAL